MDSWGYFSLWHKKRVSKHQKSIMERRPANLINPWLLGEKCKPNIICDDNKGIHLCAYLPSGNLANLKQKKLR